MWRHMVLGLHSSADEQLHLFALSIVEVKHLTLQKSSAASPNVCALPVQHPSECSGHMCQDGGEAAAR